jgi:hypothetical protein
MMERPRDTQMANSSTEQSASRPVYNSRAPRPLTLGALNHLTSLPMVPAMNMSRQILRKTSDFADCHHLPRRCGLHHFCFISAILVASGCGNEFRSQAAIQPNEDAPDSDTLSPEAGFDVRDEDADAPDDTSDVLNDGVDVAGVFDQPVPLWEPPFRMTDVPCAARQEDTGADAFRIVAYEDGGWGFCCFNGDIGDTYHYFLEFRQYAADGTAELAGLCEAKNYCGEALESRTFVPRDLDLIVDVARLRDASVFGNTEIFRYFPLENEVRESPVLRQSEDGSLFIETRDGLAVATLSIETSDGLEQYDWRFSDRPGTPVAHRVRREATDTSLTLNILRCNWRSVGVSQSACQRLGAEYDMEGRMLREWRRDTVSQEELESVEIFDEEPYAMARHIWDGERLVRTELSTQDGRRGAVVYDYDCEPEPEP